MPAQYGWLLQEPIVLTSLASEMHDEAGTSVDGRYQKHLGETHATSVLKRQDTYLVGTAGRTGYAFTAVRGRGRMIIFIASYTYCLGVGDGSPSTSTSRLRSGSVNAPGTTSNMRKGGCNGAIRRLQRMERTLPMRGISGIRMCIWRTSRRICRIIESVRVRAAHSLDVMYDGATWQLGVAFRLGNFERYLQNNNNQVDSA